MAKHQNLLVPAALALTLMASGSALAGSTATDIGGYTSAFDTPIAYQASLNSEAWSHTLATADQRLRTELQQASTVPIPQAGVAQPVRGSRDDLYNPE